MKMVKLIKDVWIWLRVRRETVEAAVDSMTQHSDSLHREARTEPDPNRRSALRAEADYIAEEKHELHEALHRGPNEPPPK